MGEVLTYASLFSAAGLGCHGFKLEGYDCVATAELLSRRLEVQKANKTCSDDAAYYLGDLSNKEFIKKIELDVKKRTNDLTFVLATPPCQGMSVANHKKGDELNRNSLVVSSLEFIENTKPRFFVLENVRAFLKSLCHDTDNSIKTIDEAIDLHLGGKYNILKRVVNLKDYSAPSSRTRTLVIGVRNDIHDITPFDIFPEKKAAPTLRELIGDLPSLQKMGQICSEDIYHSFREYDVRMRPWIQDLLPGGSAFENKDPNKRPHRIIDGKIVPNKNGNGDKYKRNVWDKIAPCIHTRNDILASQSTIHPIDDRVFSVREISRMMGVPESFKWSNFDLNQLNMLPDDQKIKFVKENDINIRQCLGEGVPTSVFQSIAAKAKIIIKSGQANDFIENITKFENSNKRQKELSAFYTRQDIAFSLLNSINLKKKKIDILEPSVGAGAFLPQIINRFQDSEINIDIVDIDAQALKISQNYLDEISHDSNFSYKSYCGDFINMDFSKRYDLIVGNPPFGSSGKFSGEFRVKDLYAKFIEKSLSLADVVALVVPKTFLSGKEFKLLREYISNNFNIMVIEDYGESAFKNIKIETIGIVLSHNRSSDTVVKSRIFNSYEFKKQNQVSDSSYPSWLIYRNEYFDNVAKQLNLGKFEAYRDRKITKAKLSNNGDIPVIKAKQIGSPSFPQTEFYCSQTEIPKGFWNQVANKKCLVVPNLSYYPRAELLPERHYVDGSAAVLIPIRKDDISIDLSFFESDDFFYFYRIARNYSVRSLNVDSISSFFWGYPKGKYISQLPKGTPIKSSKAIFWRIV